MMSKETTFNDFQSIVVSDNISDLSIDGTPFLKLLWIWQLS
jgi:hypothetical protein